MFQAAGRRQLDSQYVAHFFDVGVGTLGRAAMHEHALEVTHQTQASYLVACLGASADNANGVDAWRGQKLRRHSAGQARAHIGQITVIEQHRFAKAGLGTQQHQHRA